MDGSASTLITVEEFAAATRRSPSSVRAALRRGELPAIKLGRRWFVRWRDIEEQFERSKREIDRGEER